jgi:UDP-N-acetylmuramoyl-L-alanyl-D-glutamate--2,6-diaminopimelate ligase
VIRTLSNAPEAVQWLRARVTGTLHTDSRRIAPGDGFIAWPGAAADGRAHARDALVRGATACLVEHEGVLPFAFAGDDIAALPRLKQATGDIAAAWFGQPSQALEVVAVTGTNGKTSTTWWLAQALSNQEHSALGPCALVGTLGVGLAGRLESTGMTTPDPVLLQRSFRQFADAGARSCAIEASSIGLAEHRLAGTRIAVAVFTNFTQDHLDYHGSMSDYWEAKSRLFHWAGLTHAVVNLDDEQGVALDQALASRPTLSRWSVGIDRPARLVARDIRYTDRGMRLAVVEHDERGAEVARGELALDLIGRYNVSNLLCVIASARALGVSLTDALRACSRPAAGAGGLRPHARCAGESPAGLAAGGEAARWPPLVRDRLRWRPRPRQTSAHGGRGRARVPTRRVDQRQPAQRRSAGHPDADARRSGPARRRGGRGRPRPRHRAGRAGGRPAGRGARGRQGS